MATLTLGLGFYGALERMSALGKIAKEMQFLPMEKASIQVGSHGVFFESEDTGHFEFCFSNRTRIEGIFKLLGGKPAA